jgi:hypothetical protein
MYLDISLLDSDRVVEYTRKIGDENRYYKDIIFGLLSTNDNNKFHKYRGFNKFTAETYQLPSKNDGWKRFDDPDDLFQEYNRCYIDVLDPDPNGPDCTFDEFVYQDKKRYKKRIRESVCDPMQKLFDIRNICPIDQYKNNHNFSIYKTLDNGLVGFFVIIDKNEINRTNGNDYVVYIYGRTEDVIPSWNLFNNEVIFDNLIKKYSSNEIFIGKSDLCEMTRHSKNHGNKWDGNSILLHIDNGSNNKFKYVHIGMCVFEFETDERIEKYVSRVGNSEVPYPYAESQNFCYCMIDWIKVPNNEVVDRDIKGYLEQLYHKHEHLDNLIVISKRVIDNAKCEDDNYKKE